MKKAIITYILFVLSILSYAQPANDVCTGAINLGTLPTPNTCDGGNGLGSTVSFTGLTNVGATADNPYTYIADCQGSGTDMANPAQDVWYSITATGNAITIDISNLSGFSNHSIGFWEGNCAGLTARGCANGMGSSSTVFEPTTPGQTYFIQFSGGGTASEGTFDMDISNSNDCSQCVLGSNITVDPLPVNGTYTSGTEVNFCYTISEFEKVNTNWVHGVTIENLGSGWDATFGTGGISVTSTPGSCQGNYGDWQYYPGGAGCKGLSEPGWYYILPTSANPCQNFGDPGVAEPGGMGGCSLTFCFTMRTSSLADCNASPSPLSLGFDINTSADGETGSWTSAACGGDPVYGFSAIQACCETPTAVVDNQILCYGDSTGVATVTAGSIFDPYKYQWFTSLGTLGFETSGSSSTTNTESSLFEDTYTIVVTDNNGCQAATDLLMTTAPGASVTADVSDTICSNESKTVVSFVANPAGSTFQWTATNDIGFGTTGTTQIGTFTAINNTGSQLTSEITVVPISSLGCGGIPEIFSLSVNPSPIVAANYQIDCSSAEINSSFTPTPTSFDVEFANGLSTISSGMGGGITQLADGEGNSSITVTGITPTTLQNGQISSACFSLRHACYGDIDYFTITVNGTTYTSTSGTPAGATFNSDLASMLTAIKAGTPDVIVNSCFPSSFLDLLDGGTTNSNWDLVVYDGSKNSCSISGKPAAKGEIVDFEIIIENTPEYDFSWTNASNLTGTTSGVTTSGTLPTVIAESGGTYVLEVTDPDGCSGSDSAIFNCPLSIEKIYFNVKNINDGNFIEWQYLNNSNTKKIALERKNEIDNSWLTIYSLKSNSEKINFTDKLFKNGLNSYRLKLYQIDGSIDFSQIEVVKNEIINNKVLGIYNVFGQKINSNTKGVKFILYEDGSTEKVIDEY